MKKETKKRIMAYAFVMPSFLVVMAIVAYPIVEAIIKSFTVEGQSGFTLDNYIFLLTDELSLSHFKYTLYVVCVTVLFVMVLGYALALFLRFNKSKISKAIGVLYLIPRFIPGMVAVYAMMNVIRDSGVLNRISQAFGGNFKPGLMYNAKGLIMMNLWFNIPFAALIITSALASIPDSIIEGARDVGANVWQVFVKMILPLSIMDVMISATFCFMSNVGSFTTPYLMGPNQPKMLAIALFDQFNNYMNYERAAALSVLMFLLCSVSAGVYIYTNLKEKKWEQQ